MSERKIAQNTVFYTIALAAQKALSFIYFIFVARMIGVEAQGKYTFALSFTTIFAMLLDIGLTQVLIRETARDSSSSEKHLANVIGLKLAGSVFIYGLVALLVNLMGYPEITRQLVYVSGIVMVMDSFTLSFYGVIRGRQNLFFESFGVIANQLIVLSVGLAVLYLNLGLVALMSVYLIASLFNLIYCLAVLKIKFKIAPRISFDGELLRRLLKWSLPFAIAGIFSRIYSSIDIILLSKMSGDWSVGIYSVAYKVAFALQFVALAFSASIYPAFSNYFSHDKEKLASLFTKSMYWLMILAAPLSFGVISIADKAVGPIFGAKYLEAILPLQILMASLMFIFLCFPVGAMLNACNRQSRNTVNLGIVALFNLLANIALIPFFDFVGAAIANLLSYILLFVLGIIVMDKIIAYDKKYLIASFFKIIICCAVMYLSVILIKPYLNFAVVIALGAGIYFLMAYILKLVSPDSAKEFIRQFVNRKKVPEQI